jgi:hypothetical protein
MMNESAIPPEVRKQVAEAIRMARRELHWKLGKEFAHLQTRKAWGHLPNDATLDDYRAIISTVLATGQARVFVYHFGDTIYPTVVADLSHAQWLVMMTLDGVIETAFIVEQPDQYLTKQQFESIGTLAEVVA